MSIKLLMLSGLALLALSVNGQFYYKDLVSTRQINNNYRLYRQNKIKVVKLKSYQGNVPVQEGFICEQRVSNSGNEIVTYTKTANSPESFFTARYDQKGQLVHAVDSTEETVTTTRYTYNNTGKLESINSETRAGDNSSRTTELHQWEYRNNAPYRMFRKKNGTDTASVFFVIDEKGIVTEEETKGGKLPQKKLYYYYDDKNRLTDIVQYNQAVKRMLPNYIFEYEEDGEISTMTVVPEGTNEYQKWYYKYDDGGLRLIEFCYNKKNELLGKIEYDYQASR